MLTGGLSVGQPLPMGYSAYNVPMAYRSNYYDTPDAWYRYDNGYIYAVDPGTRMVTVGRLRHRLKFELDREWPRHALPGPLRIKMKE